MEYIIKTHKGITFTVDASNLDLNTFVSKINNRSLVVIAISDMVLNKGNIKIIHPVEQEEGPNLRELHTADGERYSTVIENYNVDELSSKINDPQNEFILIGNILIHKYQVDLIQ